MLQSLLPQCYVLFSTFIFPNVAALTKKEKKKKLSIKKGHESEGFPQSQVLRAYKQVHFL